MHWLKALAPRLKGTSMTQEPNVPDAPTQGDPSQSLPPESPATDSTGTASPLPPPTPESDLIDADEQTDEQFQARARLKDAVAEFEAALEEIVAADLDPLAELHAAGFSVGGELPPVDAGGPGDESATALGHVPEGQLPPV